MNPCVLTFMTIDKFVNCNEPTEPGPGCCLGTTNKPFATSLHLTVESALDELEQVLAYARQHYDPETIESGLGDEQPWIQFCNESGLPVTVVLTVAQTSSMDAYLEMMP